MLVAIGVKPAEASNILNLAKGTLSQSKPTVNPEYSFSQAKAVDLCPFLLITEEEYDLLHQIRQDEDVVSYITKETPPNGASANDYAFKKIEGEILARYEGILTINGAPAVITDSMITDYGSITLGYSAEGCRCYLTLSSSGTVSKTCAEYKYESTRAVYIVDNIDNGEFSKSSKAPKIIYCLFLQ